MERQTERRETGRKKKEEPKYFFGRNIRLRLGKRRYLASMLCETQGTAPRDELLTHISSNRVFEYAVPPFLDGRRTSLYFRHVQPSGSKTRVNRREIMPERSISSLRFVSSSRINKCAYVQLAACRDVL